MLLRIPSTEVLCERNDMCLSRIKPNDCAAAVQTKAAALVAMAARAAAVHGIQITAKQKYTYIYIARSHTLSLLIFSFVYFSVSRICSDATAIYRANTTNNSSMVRLFP